MVPRAANGTSVYQPIDERTMIVAALCINGKYFIPGSHHENVLFPDMPEKLCSIEGNDGNTLRQVGAARGLVLSHGCLLL